MFSIDKNQMILIIKAKLQDQGRCLHSSFRSGYEIDRRGSTVKERDIKIRHLSYLLSHP